ncbi:hypothetical protein DIPPA_33132 [Diplonema papillatum]|nr:hypothetical protein DIPPA_33132 [Diplonema papillatum]
MAACTVFWRIAGQTQYKVIKGTQDKDSVPWSDLVEQIKLKMVIPMGYSLLLRDGKGRLLEEKAPVTNATRVTVHEISNRMRDAIEQYLTLDDLYTTTPDPVVATPATKPAASPEKPRAAQLASRGSRSSAHQAPAPPVVTIPGELLCPLSKVLLDDAVLLTCCGNTVSQSAVTPLPAQCPMCMADKVVTVPDGRVRRMVKRHKEKVAAAQQQAREHFEMTLSKAKQKTALAQQAAEASNPPSSSDKPQTHTLQSLLKQQQQQVRQHQQAQPEGSDRERQDNPPGLDTAEQPQRAQPAELGDDPSINSIQQLQMLLKKKRARDDPLADQPPAKK